MFRGRRPPTLAPLPPPCRGAVLKVSPADADALQIKVVNLIQLSRNEEAEKLIVAANLQKGVAPPIALPFQGICVMIQTFNQGVSPTNSGTARLDKKINE